MRFASLICFFGFLAGCRPVSYLRKVRHSFLCVVFYYFCGEAPFNALPLHLNCEVCRQVHINQGNDHDFYGMFLKIESVYHHLLQEKSVALFGVGIAGDIGFALEAFRGAVGFDKMMDGGIEEEARAEIFRALLSSYSNLRGRDFSYKRNALADNNVKQALRVKLAVASTLAAEKKAKEKKARPGTATMNAKAARTKAGTGTSTAKST